MTYTYKTDLSWGGDEPTAEKEIEVTFTVSWGSPETPRYYMMDPAKYDPGSESVVENIKLVKVDGDERPWMIYDYLKDGDKVFEQEVIEILEDKHLERMLESAREEEESRRPDD